MTSRTTRNPWTVPRPTNTRSFPLARLAWRGGQLVVIDRHGQAHTRADLLQAIATLGRQPPGALRDAALNYRYYLLGRLVADQEAPRGR